MSIKYYIKRLPYVLLFCFSSLFLFFRYDIDDLYLLLVCLLISFILFLFTIILESFFVLSELYLYIKNYNNVEE